MTQHPNPETPRDDQDWAELLSPDRRQLLFKSGLTAGGLLAASVLGTGQAQAQSQITGTPKSAQAPRPGSEKSPWGYETYKEPTVRPVSLRPGEQTLPQNPRAYTDIKSYHAHIYFDEDSYEKAALLRKWAAERFAVELGNWNLEPRGPHVTPSFYFGFTNDLAPIIIPWLQLNSLGLSILIHPNTNDPRADHLYYALWVNRTQPVNAYAMPKGPVPNDQIEKIIPNITPTRNPEV